jgi:hypothetical protein
MFAEGEGKVYDNSALLLQFSPPPIQPVHFRLSSRETRKSFLQSTCVSCDRWIFRAPACLVQTLFRLQDRRFHRVPLTLLEI